MTSVLSHQPFMYIDGELESIMKPSRTWSYEFEYGSFPLASEKVTVEVRCARLVVIESLMRVIPLVVKVNPP